MIFYFSATGNSYFSASILENNLSDYLINITNAIKVKQFFYELKQPDENVGFIFPVYYYGLPSIVEEFIAQLRILDTKKAYVYAVITCGGKIMGADAQLSRLLKKRKIMINATFELLMPENNIILYNAPTMKEQEYILRLAHEKLADITKIIKNGGGGYKSNAFDRIKTMIYYPLYQHGRKTRKFKITTACIGCGLCQKICPINAIRMENSIPRWILKQCIHCLGCINRCPKKAIEYGTKTKDKERYWLPI